MKGQGRREIPENSRPRAVSSGTIPTRENPGSTSPGIELASVAGVLGSRIIGIRDGNVLANRMKPLHIPHDHVVQCLDETYPGRCGGAVAWPSRSPDLTPLD
ncbi:hypothetical protein PR048_030789 [Dryococelus australis]|uniref:Uncharacterized protein n=1 Tax=Dryococelus australis TaxID=614101 RepID=A0ABQ9GCK7_9NEOP|nr:hypothetical protein PR048_030789 [Dryococelus australis]